MAHTARIRPHFIDISFSGTVDRHAIEAAGGLSEGELTAILRLGRVLLDFTDITDFRFDTFTLGDSMRQLSRQGLRLAICSSTPAMFGVGRQIAQWSDVEGSAIRVFRDRDQAEAWLVCPDGEGPGGQ
ncbi:MAG: hypothetical protein ACRDHF_19530 [Tepidiformaceae bacterium]